MLSSVALGSDGIPGSKCHVKGGESVSLKDFVYLYQSYPLGSANSSHLGSISPRGQRHQKDGVFAPRREIEGAHPRKDRSNRWLPIVVRGDR